MYNPHVGALRIEYPISLSFIYFRITFFDILYCSINLILKVSEVLPKLTKML